MKPDRLLFYMFLLEFLALTVQKPQYILKVLKQPTETFLLRYSTVKQKIMNGCGLTLIASLLFSRQGFSNQSLN